MDSGPAWEEPESAVPASPALSKAKWVRASRIYARRERRTGQNLNPVRVGPVLGDGAAVGLTAGAREGRAGRVLRESVLGANLERGNVGHGKGSHKGDVGNGEKVNGGEGEHLGDESGVDGKARTVNFLRW